jgi:hypothetical protein
VSRARSPQEGPCRRMNVTILLFGVVLILGSLLAATYALFR